ncbi:hypothetical protein N431DRAFT_439803 [Stipitochalara longipes BDJ]|nr:hypothetical protein N431DRAFT_439803 [Stipitochalara longipes BDJ]
MAMNHQPRIFLLPELLQAVFLHLPLRDLLLMQLVCRKWKDTIERSLVLQRKLFFQPVSDLSQEPVFNPLLREVCGPLFRLHRDKWDRHFLPPWELLKWRYDDNQRPRFLRPEASWRRMLPVQPPAKIDSMTSEGGCGCVETKERGTIHKNSQHLQKGGASMGLLWDVVIDMMDKYQGTTVFVHWHMFPLVPASHEYDEKTRDEMLEGVETTGDTVPEYYEYDEEDSDEMLEVVEPTGNTVTVHVRYGTDCYPSAPKPCGLSVGSFDKDIVEWI